jgi:hypothetical protein
MSTTADDLSTSEPAGEAAKIEQILAAVRQNARQQLPVPSVTGLVVGGDAEELRVATRTGIVGVPTGKILRTIHPIASRRDIATFYLADLDTVRSIFPVQPLGRFGGGDELVAARYLAFSSSTAEAGESMTADPIAGVNADDSEVHHTTDDSHA